MKRNRIFSAVAVAVAAVAMTACNNSQPKMDEQPANASTAEGGVKIAYVEVDSLMTQYKFAKEFAEVLQKKGNNARNTLNQKGQQLQAAAANFQQKLQNNGFASREQAESQQAAIQRQQQSLQELQDRLAQELDAETAKYNEALRDSLNHFLKEYNKVKKFDIILSKAGDNILYASKAYDITQEVVNGLNKSYKGGVNNAKPAASEKKEEAKK